MPTGGDNCRQQLAQMHMSSRGTVGFEMLQAIRDIAELCFTCDSHQESVPCSCGDVWLLPSRAPIQAQGSTGAQNKAEPKAVSCRVWMSRLITQLKGVQAGWRRGDLHLQEDKSQAHIRSSLIMLHPIMFFLLFYEKDFLQKYHKIEKY